MFAFKNKQSSLVIGIWLATCCVLVLCLIVLGGAVRLTGSGLSMVQWQPILGILPPFNIQEWEVAFNLYQQYPEYQLINRGMSLHEFKFIFYMEYFHRLLGRLVGLVFVVPLASFAITGRIAHGLKKHLFLLLGLGLLQGIVGWYMVKSGLIDNPHVSQYRLALHLSIAVIIYGYMVYLLVRIFMPTSAQDLIGNRLVYCGRYLLPLLFIMILSGGFVAGTKAGYIYNTFPKMEGYWFPPGAFSLSPVWINFFENPVTIQLVHRLLALTVFIFVIGYSVLLLREKNAFLKILSGCLLLVVVAQVLLGITTLLMDVPIILGVLHQAGAMVLFAIIIIVVTLLACYRQ